MDQQELEVVYKVREEEEFIVPEDLRTTQEWFAGMITTELDENGYSRLKTSSGMLAAEEAARYIVPSPFLKPHERIQIYNQQFWWRLLKNMQESFPLVTRLFGHHDFNETLSTPFLLKNLPNHWCLNLLGERFPRWVAEDYYAKDKQLVLDCAELDWAFSASFVAAEYPSLRKKLLHDTERLLSATFYLQPHIFIFEWEYELMSFRDSFLKKDVEYWEEHEFPLLNKDKTYRFVLYRGRQNLMYWKELTKGEYALLNTFKGGATIEKACEYLENDPALYEEATSHLQEWLQNWVGHGWLVHT